jgi:hypothetical protein
MDPILMDGAIAAGRASRAFARNLRATLGARAVAGVRELRRGDLFPAPGIVESIDALARDEEPYDSELADLLHGDE